MAILSPDQLATVSVLPRSTPTLLARIGAWVALAAVLGALAWTAGQDLAIDERLRLIHYLGILTSGTIAIAAPHVLFPDRRAAWLQLANVGPARLLRHQLGRWLPMLGILAVPLLVLASGAPDTSQRIHLGAQALAGMLAVGVLALARSAALGERMRAWHEERRGGWYRRIYQTAPPYRFAVPDELVPGLLMTGEIFLAGSVLAILGRGANFAAWGVVPSLVLLGLSVGAVLRLRPAYDRAFYATHGAWADAFHATSGPAAGREPIGYDAVYWSPRALRAAVWAGLVSLDRRLPLGRAVTAGLILVALAEFAGAAEGVRNAALLLLILAVNSAVALTVDAPILPTSLAGRLHGPGAWARVRVLMNLRWLPPVAVAVALIAVFSDRVDAADILVWSGIYAAAAYGSAAIVTAVSHYRLRREHA